MPAFRTQHRKLNQVRSRAAFTAPLTALTLSLRGSRKGIFGQWFICEPDDEEDPVTPNTLDIANEIQNIRRSFLLTCRFGALLQPVGNSQLSWRKSQTMTRYQGRVVGTLLVAVGCNKASWNGVDIGCTSGDGKVSMNGRGTCRCWLSRRIQFALFKEDWRDLG
jgi:hypothetical protein